MSEPTGRRLTRGLVITGTLALGLVAGGGGVASAHITVSAPQAGSGGSDAVISFRVPDESESARTVGLKLRLPTDTPIAAVLVQPKPGWTSTLIRSKLSTPITTDDGDLTEVVSQIEWKATGAGIGPGEFDQFVIIAGQLPAAKRLTFKAIQTFSDGTTVSWIEQPAPGSTAEPEHPAPVLTLAASSAGSSAGASAPPRPAEAASKAAATTGIVLGALGALLGAAALAVALRRRRT